MLPPFIIEQIRQREENLRQREQPVLELPLEESPVHPPEHPGAVPEGVREPGAPAGNGNERGVVILQM